MLESVDGATGFGYFSRMDFSIAAAFRAKEISGISSALYSSDEAVRRR